MSAFKVSIIIPVYNREQYIDNAVESCVHLPQTGEVLIIDDGSTDNTVEHIKLLAAKYPTVKLLLHPDHKNHGCSASRNLGIQQAKYEYVSFLDSDDRYLPKRFDYEEKIFLQNKEIDGVYGITSLAFENKAAQDCFFKQFHSEIFKIDEEVNSNNLYKTFLFSNQGQWHTDAVVLKKTAFSKAGMFPDGVKFCEDVHLWCRLAAKCTLVSNQNPNPVAQWYIHHQNTILNINDIHNKSFKYLYHSLFKWALKQKDFPYDKKNDFFIGYKKMYPNESDFKTLARFLGRNPRFLLHRYTLRKCAQIIKGK